LSLSSIFRNEVWINLCFRLQLAKLLNDIVNEVRMNSKNYQMVYG